MPATMVVTREQVLLLEFLSQHPEPPRYTLKQPGDEDRMDRIWPMLSRCYVAHRLNDREE
jgi:hypothetical protein